MINFFETFLECSLPSTVLKKKTIKNNKNDTSPFSINRCDGFNLALFMPVLMLIMHVIHRSTLHFAVA